MTTPLKLVLVLFLLSLLAMPATWVSLHEVWLRMDYPYSYGYLGLALCCYFLWHSFRTTSIETTQSKSLYAASIALLTASSVTWFISNYLQIQIATQLLLPALLQLAIFGLFGQYAFVKTTPAFAFLYLSIPIWNYLNSSLQTLTTEAVTIMIGLSSIPAFIEGNFINLSHGTLEVAGGCSGLRYFLVSIVLAHYYNTLYISTLKSKISILALTISFGIFANWIRVYGLVLIAHHTEMESSLIQDHETYGWIVFAICMFPVFFSYRFFDQNIELIRENLDIHLPSKVQIALVIAAFVIGPISLYSLNKLTKLSDQPQYQWEQHSPAGWINLSAETPSWELGYKGWSANQSMVFRSQYSNQKVEGQIAFYTLERQGQELISDQNHLMNNQDWKLSKTPSKWVTPTTVQVSSKLASKGFQRKIFMSFYQVGTTKSLGGLKTKLDQLKYSLQPDTPKSFNAFSMNCRTDCKSEAKILSLFIDEFLNKNTISQSNNV